MQSRPYNEVAYDFLVIAGIPTVNGVRKRPKGKSTQRGESYAIEKEKAKDGLPEERIGLLLKVLVTTGSLEDV